jgi:hypothetical protein
MQARIACQDASSCKGSISDFVVSNVRHAITWCCQVRREMNAQVIYGIAQRMSKILLANWSVRFAIYNEHEKLRMKKTTNGLTSRISSLNLGSEKMLIEKYVQLAG